MPSGMETKPKCKCRKLDLPRAGKVVIRCPEHLGKPSKKRLVCYFDEQGIVRRESDRIAKEIAAHTESDPHGECVYFARLGDLIKIGRSRDPVARAEQLNATLLALMPGGRKLESTLHRKFAAHRESGEWFRVQPELLAFIEELP